MIDGLMDTLCTETLEPTFQELDDELSRNKAKEVIPPVENIKVAADKPKGKTKKRTKQTEEKKKTVTLEGRKLFPINVDYPKVKAEKMDAMEVGDTIFIDRIRAVQTGFGINYIMYTADEDRAFWSNKMATSIIDSNNFDFHEQFFIITKTGDKEFEYFYTPRAKQIKALNKLTGDFI